MASVANGSEQAWQAQDVRLAVDTIPTLAWSARSDGSADFFNQRWLDYTGLSAEQARDWGWTVALHSDDLNGLVDYWRSVLASGEPSEIEGRLRRFDGVYRWFLFRATPSFDNDGRVVKWFGTNTDIEDRKRAECLLAGENLVLEMTAKGCSLESILEALCRVVEQTASGCCCSVVLIDPSGSTIEQAVAPSLPSSYNDRFPGCPVDPEGGPCTEAARHKTQVIVPDIAVFLQFIKDSMAGRTPNVQRIGISYMYGGKWVPNKSHAMGSGAEFHVGPHIMIIGLDQKTMQTLNQDASNGEPYVNHLPGHTELFLVIPIREWDDAQAVHTVGAETR